MKVVFSIYVDERSFQIWIQVSTVQVQRVARLFLMTMFSVFESFKIPL